MKLQMMVALNEECRKKDEEREVEAENEASPICEKNGENRDDGGVKERCKEKEEEKVVESSSICEKNDKTRGDGATKEACREKKVDVSTKPVEEGQEKKRRRRWRRVIK